MDNTKTAKELLLSYLANINNPDQAIALFADDATIELPYLGSLGMPWKWHGKETLYNFLKSLPETFPRFEFVNIRIHIDTPDQAFGEYDADCMVASTGLPYNQTYMGRLVEHHPSLVIVNSGAARFLTGDPITMDVPDIVSLCSAFPHVRVVAVHLESVNHCLLSRGVLKEEMSKAGLGKRVHIPDDGDTF